MKSESETDWGGCCRFSICGPANFPWVPAGPIRALDPPGGGLHRSSHVSVLEGWRANLAQLGGEKKAKDEEANISVRSSFITRKNTIPHRRRLLGVGGSEEKNNATRSPSEQG